MGQTIPAVTFLRTSAKTEGATPFRLTWLELQDLLPRQTESTPDTISGMILVFGSVVPLGTIGYRLIEESPWVDSLYMVIITGTTVGFGENHPLSVGGKIFTIFLIVLGIMGITYALRAGTDYVIETGCRVTEAFPPL